MGSANERRRYNVTSSIIGWAHTQNDPADGTYRTDDEFMRKLLKKNNKLRIS